MAEQLYSAEEAAEILGLQVRTVRNYVREGRLPGVRIGKQYRIARADLEAFTGGGPAPFASGVPASGVAASGVPAVQTPPSRPGVAAEVSSVVQVDGIPADSADRVGRTLEAALASRLPSDPRLRVEPIYDDERERLKVVIVGTPADAVELIRIIDAVTRDGA